MSDQDVVYLGIGRYVMALSPDAGEVFCLDPRTGEIRWRAGAAGAAAAG